MLIERPVEFANEFRMRCEKCNASNWLSSEDYFRIPDAIMTCDGCRKDFNFGPAVVDLTDPEDPALSDAALPDLAWYHTTTDPEWPRTSRPLEDSLIWHLRERAHWPEEQIERYRRRHENQAIHLGTYEAAIDSMLRRIRDENEHQKSFYLHRVRLRPDVKIESGWRNENSAIAAKITKFDLTNDYIDGVRYLNAHEAIGSLSLAVIREAIESTQRISVPIPELIDQLRSRVVDQVRAFRKRVLDIRAAQVSKPPSFLETLRLRTSELPGGSPPIEPIEAYDALLEMAGFAADEYLGGLSPAARDNFLRSLQRPRPVDGDEVDLAWLYKFMGLAALLTRPCEVQKILSEQPWQTPQTG
ncbi:hypothetical protein GCM10027405_30420 [Arthrobacter alkaliphilus]|uniref:hypothetical protein n=1 Tax=Arthrobacter alkaliphilus TaxID=369936 RepID=UPI001F2FB4E4|nr:hypothetical protein [Arthrobacter alkaliphilus]